MAINLIKVISLDKEKCVNCHACITICPVKYCNNVSGETVSINEDMCLACGSCIRACTHAARSFIDDFDSLIASLQENQDIVAVVAPSIAANFPNQYLKINAWLKSMGIKAVLDVSFGAELTVKSYLEYIFTVKPKIAISQACPAIVTYIEIYRPELIKYLVPRHSPMLHTIKMIDEFYPQYKNFKVAVISPCNAKKREFEQTGYGDFNVAYQSIDKYLKDKNIDLNSLQDEYYENPEAERAVLFSTPGGLISTIERIVPDIRHISRKIEGVHTIYKYLDKLPEIISSGFQPLFIDCLNCENGCNAGPLTLNVEKSPDEIEFWINQRNINQQAHYKKINQEDNKQSIDQLLEKYWHHNIYNRDYTDRSANNTIQTPNEIELLNIYESMYKFSDKDMYNCSACGYGSCTQMAVAIFNGLNRPENCHFYLAKESENLHNEILELNKSLDARVKERTVELYETLEELKSVNEIINETNIELEKLSIVASNTQNVVFILDAGGNLEWTNRALKEVYGYEQEEFVKKYGRNIVDFSNNDRIGYILKNCKITQKSFTYENKHTTKNGMTLWTQTCITPIIEHEKVVKIIAVDSDITEIKLAHEEIINQREEILNQKEELLAQRDELMPKSIELDEKLEELQTTTTVLNQAFDELEQKQSEIMVINKELIKQKDEIVKQTKQITDSIEYAKRIQEALLKFNKNMAIEQYFILFKPKDIVSGDFYWTKQILNYSLIAVADCTGHGVPGAFMSMLGISFLEDISDLYLNRLNNSNINAANILDKLSHNVIESLNQNDISSDSKDGMNMVICIINKNLKEMQFASAYNPLWLLREDEIIEFKVDKMPIGIHASRNRKNFTNNIITILPHDKYYLFTDGYTDQFGGESKRKFMKHNLRKLILDLKAVEMKQQGKYFDERITQWKDESVQTDDILVIGFEIEINSN